ncbi:MAG TPA: hypothetical protein PK406_14560 [Verrucomicrobiota bacterium]|nr:hypothetical protein [Verrucomicrobiota bacterium]
MPLETDLLGTRLTLAAACARLGVRPTLRPGETITWMRLDPRTGAGINAGLYCYDPARHDEPYVLSLGAYEEARLEGPNGEDYGTDRTVIANLDFALDRPDGEAPPPLADPPEARLKLVKAELGGALGEDDDRTLAEVLAEVGRILAQWPSERTGPERWAAGGADGTD